MPPPTARSPSAIDDRKVEVDGPFATIEGKRVQVESDRDVDGLKGPVKRVIEGTLVRKDPRDPKAPMLRKRTRETAYYRNGRLSETVEYVYCAGCPDDQVLSVTTYSYDASTAQHSTTEYMTTPGPTIGRSPEGPNDPKTVFQYNARGVRTEVAYLERDGSVAWRLAYVFNVDGGRIGFLRYGAGGSLDRVDYGPTKLPDGTVVFEMMALNYDSNQASIERWSNRYQYDEFGNWVHNVQVYSRYENRKETLRVQSEEFRAIEYY